MDKLTTGGGHMSIKNFFKSKFSRGKASRFFDREGFYIVLFLCVCIVAITAVWVSRTNLSSRERMDGTGGNNTNVETPVTETPESEITSEEASNLEESEDEGLPVTSEVEVSEEDEEVKEDETEEDQKAAEPTKAPAAVNFGSPLKDGYSTEDIVEHYSPEEPVFYEYLDQWNTHSGLDIKATIGTEVLAVYGGTVVEVVNDNDLLDGLGWKVVIDHKNGYKSVYANLDEELAVKEGQTVKKGEKIGVVGKTSAFERPIPEGSGDVSHLHFELLKKGAKSYENVDPNKYLPVQE